MAPGKIFETGSDFFLLVAKIWSYISLEACNTITKNNYVIAVVNSGICCSAVRLFNGKNYMYLQSALSFWKLIYNNLRSTCFSKVTIIFYDFSSICIFFFWIIWIFCYSIVVMQNFKTIERFKWFIIWWVKVFLVSTKIRSSGRLLL